MIFGYFKYSEFWISEIFVVLHLVDPNFDPHPLNLTSFFIYLDIFRGTDEKGRMRTLTSPLEALILIFSSSILDILWPTVSFSLAVFDLFICDVEINGWLVDILANSCIESRSWLSMKGTSGTVDKCSFYVKNMSETIEIN